MELGGGEVSGRSKKKQLHLWDAAAGFDWLTDIERRFFDWIQVDFFAKDSKSNLFS
jgi:hypothetical protein